MTHKEFKEKFRLNYNLIGKDKSATATWESFQFAVRRLRSDAIHELKLMGMPGWMRAEYNELLSGNSKYGYKEYMFFKDPTCRLCRYPIADLEETTIDHIVPKAIGGENSVENYQLAHGRCNVLKGSKNIRSFHETVVQ